MQQTILDPVTKAFLNTMKPNEVRESATEYWPTASAADWDGSNLYLGYGASHGWTKTHWHKCSSVMAKSLADWIQAKR